MGFLNRNGSNNFYLFNSLIFLDRFDSSLVFPLVTGGNRETGLAFYFMIFVWNGQHKTKALDAVTGVSASGWLEGEKVPLEK